MLNQNCHFCSGHLEEKKVTRIQQVKDRWIIIENLPALVCKQCGERYYTPDAHDRVLAIVNGDKEPSRRDEIDIYDAA